MHCWRSPPCMWLAVPVEGPAQHPVNRTNCPFSFLLERAFAVSRATASQHKPVWLWRRTLLLVQPFLRFADKEREECSCFSSWIALLLLGNCCVLACFECCLLACSGCLWDTPFYSWVLSHTDSDDCTIERTDTWWNRFVSLLDTHEEEMIVLGTDHILLTFTKKPSPSLVPPPSLSSPHILLPPSRIWRLILNADIAKFSNHLRHWVLSQCVTASYFTLCHGAWSADGVWLTSTGNEGCFWNDFLLDRIS